MTFVEQEGKRNLNKLTAIGSIAVAAAVLGLAIAGASVGRFLRESLMQRATSAHYEILFPRGLLFPGAMLEYASGRDQLFATLAKKLGLDEPNLKIRIILDPDYSAQTQNGAPAYSVTGTTVRTTLTGRTPRVPEAADAEAILYAAWGKPGNAQIARWTAAWLAGDWHGMEIGMAASQLEQKTGHQRLASVLQGTLPDASSPNDQTLLGAAWISEVAEFGGAQAVRKVYAEKMAQPNAADAARALGTTPLELDRKWQMWMYAYLAGMPPSSSDHSMPMTMPMQMPMDKPMAGTAGSSNAEH